MSIDALSEAHQIERTLDALHKAAAHADGATYWSLFSAGAVFLGTDASERWTIDEFKAYANARFEQGQGWTYTPTARHIALHDSGQSAWFDELLLHDRYGVCRGSGVLVRCSENPLVTCDGFGGPIRWKIAQYNLSVPIPNDLLPELAEKIRSRPPSTDH